MECLIESKSEKLELSILDWAIQIADGISHLHSIDIIHGDIKPK